MSVQYIVNKLRSNLSEWIDRLRIAVFSPDGISCTDPEAEKEIRFLTRKGRMPLCLGAFHKSESADPSYVLNFACDRALDGAVSWSEYQSRKPLAKLGDWIQAAQFSRDFQEFFLDVLAVDSALRERDRTRTPPPKAAQTKADRVPAQSIRSRPADRATTEVDRRTVSDRILAPTRIRNRGQTPSKDEVLEAVSKISSVLSRVDADYRDDVVAAALHLASTRPWT